MTYVFWDVLLDILCESDSVCQEVFSISCQDLKQTELNGDWINVLVSAV